MVQLIITEKPKSAQRIAEALADGKPIKKGAKGVYYYEITHGNTDIIVACAVGHLFGIAEKNKKKGMKYPVFDIEWKPLYEINKHAAFSKKYYDNIKKLAKKADSFVVSCDWDIEGELIGLTILKYLCKQKDGKRMKFSTLTKPDLRKAYENLSPTIEWGLATAGDTRHRLDFYYGINLTRALTASIKKAGMFKILSIGRVQGPALRIVVEKEKEIADFKPEPYWELELEAEGEKGAITALHSEDKFKERKETEAIFSKVKGKNGKISEVKRTDKEQKPPVPFDLTTLQTEAYKCFGISPKITLSIAQDLYTAGFISYPRTSSQQLPQSIGYEKILKQLKKNSEYAELCGELLKNKKLAPNNGKKTDPAHPAIYPTGIKPRVKDQNQKIYDLIARRFMATFAEPAVRETMKVKIDVEDEIFEASGIRTKRPGWHRYYGPYAKQKEEELPDFSEGEEMRQKRLDILDKETKPPARFTQASIIKELEKRRLGTKSTRAEVVDTLYQRGYISEKAIMATELGIKAVETLHKYSPKVVEDDLTRRFEEEMEEIMEHKKTPEKILDDAKSILTEILEVFKEKEEEIGSNLLEATKRADAKANTVGKCMKCEDGTLMIKRGKFGKFIGCTGYPDCEATHKLPASALPKPTDKICEKCSYPVIMLIKKRKQPQEACINLDCPEKILKSDKENTKCEKCPEGTIVLRKSVYGQFLACDKFPKCRNVLREEKKES